MLIKVNFTIIVIAVMVSTSSCIKINPQKKDIIITSPSAELLLSDSDLKSAKIRAMEGDADAALQVSLHYSVAKLDTISSIGWMNIAANHGNVIAQYSLGSIYMVDNRIKNIKLAKYWLVEAEKNGSTEAKKLLKRIGESETNQKVNSHD